MSINEGEIKREISRRVLWGLALGLGIAATAAETSRRGLLSSPEQKDKSQAPQSISSSTESEVNFGIRNDVAALMPLAKKLGAGHVRIEGQDRNIKTNNGLRNTLNAASALNLPVLYVFNSPKPLPSSEINDLLSPIVHIYSGEIEVGNEVDNLAIPCWEELHKRFHENGDRNLYFDSFAQHTAETIKVIRQLDKIRRSQKPTKIVIGALSDTQYAQVYKECMEDAGINFNDPALYWAVHAFHEISEVEGNIETLLKAGYPAERLRITEIGMQGEDKSKLTEMIRIGYQLTKNPVTMHELPNMNPENEPDMGIADLESITLGFEQIAEFIHNRGMYK